MNIALKVKPESWKEVVSSNIEALTVFIAISLVAAGIISCYTKSSEVLIKTIEFGLSERKSKILLTNA